MSSIKVKNYKPEMYQVNVVKIIDDRTGLERVSIVVVWFKDMMHPYQPVYGFKYDCIDNVLAPLQRKYPSKLGKLAKKIAKEYCFKKP